jgi:hypothetical protein
MGWFRMWDDILDSVKLHRLPAETAWAWVRLLGAANRHDFDGGTLPDLDTLSFWLRVSPQDAGRMIDDCLRAGLLDSEDGDVMVIHDWRHWQRPKDATAADRMKKHRNATRNGKRNANRNVKRNAPVTPTVTVTGEEEDGRRKKKTEEEEKDTPPSLPPVGGIVRDGRKLNLPDAWDGWRMPLHDLCNLHPYEWVQRAVDEYTGKDLGDPVRYLAKVLVSWKKNGGPPEVPPVRVANGTAAKHEKWDPEEQRAYYAARYEAQEAEAARKAGA